jgi:mono/diheme cytochrome c family protein
METFVRYGKLLAMGLALILGSGSTPVPVSKSDDTSQRDVDNGKRMFASAGCAACHGVEGQGTSLAPALAPPPLELPALIAYARHPTGKMPPVPVATASDQELAEMYRFLRSVAPKGSLPEELTGNAENGKKLFIAYGCYECHGRQGAGAATAPRIGPPALSLAGVLRYVRRPTGQMPPYTAKVVSDQDLADIYSYLKTFPPPPSASGIPLLNQ